MPLTRRRVRMPTTRSRLKASAPPQSQVSAWPSREARRRFRASWAAPSPPDFRRGVGSGATVERAAGSELIVRRPRLELRIALAQPLPHELRDGVEDEGEDEEKE